MTRLRSSAARQFALWVLGGFLVGWLVSVLWWSLLEPSGKNAPAEIVIPPGAAELIAAGRPVPGVPSVIRAGRTGYVSITNNDTVEHYLGGALIRPGATAIVRPAKTEGTIQCTFHAAGAVGYQLDERPPITVTVIPAAILGVPFGIAFGVATIVARRLGDDTPDLDPART